jgi:hypothetical protein
VDENFESSIDFEMLPIEIDKKRKVTASFNEIGKILTARKLNNHNNAEEEQVTQEEKDVAPTAAIGRIGSKHLRKVTPSPEKCVDNSLGKEV